MYKGMVLKVTTEYAVVITDDHSFCKITFKEGLMPGQRIYFFEEDKLGNNYQHARKAWFSDLQKKSIALTVMAACIAFFFLFNGVFGLEPKDSSYFAVVSVDINPSVELKLNEGSYVIGVEALNQDGKKVSGNYLLGLKVDKAVSRIIESAEKMNYLNLENDTVLLATALNTIETEQMQSLMNQLANIQLPKEYSYLIIPMNKDEVLKAKDNKLSLGKYAMLDLAGGNFRAEEVRNMKVKDLITSKTIQAKIQEKEEQKLIKSNSKIIDKEKDKDKDEPANNAPQKYTVKDITSGKITNQGASPKNDQQNGNQANQGQGASREESPGQGKNTSKGKPDKEQFKIKPWSDKIKSFLFPKAVQ